MLSKPNCPIIAIEEHYSDAELIALFTGLDASAPPHVLKALEHVGEARLKDIVFTARAVEAPEALAIGLATEVVDDADARVAELCELIASHAAVTMRVTKEALRRLRPLADGDDLVREAYASEEFRRRVKAFLER